MTVNRSWVLAHRPDGAVRTSDFARRDELFTPPTLADGDVLVRSRIFSCPPTIRNWLNAPGRSYRGAIGIGEAIRGMAAVEVVASRHAGFPVGRWLTAVAPWQDFSVLRPDEAAVPMTLIAEGVDPVDAMTLYSPNSLTAYFGLFAVGELRSGMTVLVSGAAGSVGSMACQLARAGGCRVIAVAGGAEKCRWLETVAGVAVAIDYKADGLASALEAASPNRINLFFDNVGGDILQLAIDRMAPHGRVVVSGQISAYDTDKTASGPRDMMKLVYGRIRMEGFLVGDFTKDYETAINAIRMWAASGHIRRRFDIRESFDNLPRALVDILHGNNTGTLLIRA